MMAGRCRPEVQGRFERPTDRRRSAVRSPKWDRHLSRSAELAPGQWDLVLEGVAAGQRLFVQNRVLLN